MAEGGRMSCEHEHSVLNCDLCMGDICDTDECPVCDDGLNTICKDCHDHFLRDPVAYWKR